MAEFAKVAAVAGEAIAGLQSQHGVQDVLREFNRLWSAIQAVQASCDAEVSQQNATNDELESIRSDVYSTRSVIAEYAQLKSVLTKDVSDFCLFPHPLAWFTQLRPLSADWTSHE